MVAKDTAVPSIFSGKEQSKVVKKTLRMAAKLKVIEELARQTS